MIVSSETEVTMNYRHAIADALGAAMEKDDTVVLLGEDIGAAGGVFKSTEGLIERFGSNRVWDTPISEQAIIGASIGAAVMGLRPVAEIMFADFVGVCFDQVANQLAKYRYVTGGQASVPVTIRLLNGAGLGFASQHSQAVENWFLGIPGLKIVVPATPQDIHGLLRSAIADPDPVLVFEHKALLATKGAVDATAPPIRLGVADIVRLGTDVSIVATQLMRLRSEEAADHLASQGIAAEVIDPRTLVPFDYSAVTKSLAKTSRLVCVQEGPSNGGWAASLIARVVTEDFELLDAPPQIVTSPAVPVPYAKELESAWLPTVEDIVSAAKRAVTY